jgi:hypothetical protein
MATKKKTGISTNKTAARNTVALKLIQDNAAQYSTVLVRFPSGGKLYSYYAKASWDINIGDTVTVATKHAPEVEVTVEGLMPLSDWMAQGGTIPTSQITGKIASYDFPETDVPVIVQLLDL